MKKELKKTIALGALLAAFNVGAEGSVKPYAGLDYYRVWMQGKNAVTIRGTAFSLKTAMPTSYPGAGAYVGLKVMKNLGIELGGDFSKKRGRSATVPAGVGNTVTYSSKVKRNGVHVDLVGFWPLYDCLSMMGSVGVGRVKANISDGLYITNGGVGTAIPASSKARMVPRAGIGALCKLSKGFGLRAKVGFEGTNGVVANINNQGDAKVFKDTISLSVGAFVEF